MNMSNNTIPDIDVRDEIKNNLDVNILVEAGAGSGKTTSMVNRMISLIVSGKYNIENIAAITFTRKAAQELKERFQNSLEQCFYEQQNPEQKDILKKALKNIERCFIGTIHSFCASILRERSVEASIDPDFTELDDITDMLLHKQAWQQYLLDVRLNSPEALSKLNDCGIKPSDLEDIYLRITQYPDVEIVFNEVKKPDFTRAHEKLKLFLESVRNYIPKTEPEKGYDSLQSRIMTGLRMLRYYDMDSEINRLNLLEMFENDQKVTLNRWLCDKETTKEINQDINHLSETEIRPVIKRWKEYCHYIAVSFLKPAAEYYENIKVKQSGLNFQDLLLKTVNMLKNYPEVCSYFKNKYRCLLIDEFQDTDPIQAEIMFFLTGKDIYEKQWYKLVPSPGSLFVVGDPKQSIYRFRRADIDIYNRVKQLFLQTGGNVLELTANFRSMNNLGQWFNKAFFGLFPAEADSFQAAFSPANTVKDEAEGTDSGVRILSIPADFAKKQEIVEQDADNIARVIRNAVDGEGIKLDRTPEEREKGLSETPEYRDFLILLRYKDSIDVYAKTLKKYGIPVKISGGGYLSDIEELKEFVILLRFLNDPENQVLLVAVLRGLFFGISDRSIAQYKLSGGVFKIYAEVPESLDEDTKALFETAFSKLSIYHKWSRDYHPVTAFEKIAADIGLFPLTLTGAEPQTGCAYIIKILEMLRKNTTGEYGGFNLLVDLLDAIFDAGLEEELDITGDEQDAVRIMNLHKAKGLEAPVVFLAHPCKRPNISPDHHIKRTGSKSKGYFVIKKQTGEFSSKMIGRPLNWDKYELEEKEYQDAEETRLLYVAATRAKNLLFISGSEKSNAKNPWEPLLGFMDKDKDTYQVPEARPTKQMQPEMPVLIRKQDLEDFKNEINGFITTSAQPTYTELSVSDVISDEPLHTVKGGLGPEWGSAIHEIIESLVRDEAEYEIYKTMILRQYGFTDPEYETKAEELIKKFKESGLYSRIQNAEAKLAEVPFSIKLDASDSICGLLNIKNPLPVILQGKIDLAIKEKGGWSIIDYKTNYFEKEEDLNLLINHYSKQIKLYCLVWEKITKEKVAGGELYFTGTGCSVIVNI